jgi:hypothetical protein
VPDKDKTLTSAGCIILSSVVPNLMHGETSCGNTLENIVSVVSAFVKVRIVKLQSHPHTAQTTKSVILAFRC